jgi:hypothetical protein
MEVMNVCDAVSCSIGKSHIQGADIGLGSYLHPTASIWQLVN